MRDNHPVSERYFTIAEAEELLPLVRAATGQLASLDKRLRAEIAAHPVGPQDDGFRSRAAFLLNDEMHRVVRWFQRTGIQIKGLAPPLVDFPARAGDREILLCWRHGEEKIGFYHDLQSGFAGRRPISEL